MFYNRNGEMICKGNYKNDNKEGIWHYFDSEGKELRNESFSQTGIVSKTSSDSKNKKPKIISKKTVKSSVLPYTKPAPKNDAQRKPEVVKAPVIKNITKPIINYAPTEEEVNRKKDSIKNAAIKKNKIIPTKITEEKDSTENK